ncbi:MAG: class I SAM-dependent methyltransferase [Myxococcota bacterium]
MPRPNWFDRDNESYARYRPSYPDELLQALCAQAPRSDVAVDVGCGTGQLSLALASRFDEVYALDPSRSQLQHAPEHPRIDYREASAESMPLDDGTAALMTAAQAVHWFELDRFCAEARRVLSPDGVLALIAYGACRLEDRIHPLFESFYLETLGPYWSPERALVDEGYQSLQLPFAELPSLDLEIRAAWAQDQIIGYVGTWSAVRRARASGSGDLLDRFAKTFAQALGDPERRVDIAWPVYVRLFRMSH